MRSVVVLTLLLTAACISVAGAENAGMSAANSMGQTASNVSSAAMNTTSGNASGPRVTVGVTAQGIAFNTSTITVPAGASVTVIFNNKDGGVPHNIAFYQSSALNNPIYVGAIFNGPKVMTYHFTAPSNPGTYYFRCDVHPQMNGKFIVK